jgi:hypothetical protein
MNKLLPLALAGAVLAAPAFAADAMPAAADNVPAAMGAMAADASATAPATPTMNEAPADMGMPTDPASTPGTDGAAPMMATPPMDTPPMDDAAPAGDGDSDGSHPGGTY